MYGFGSPPFKMLAAFGETGSGESGYRLDQPVMAGSAPPKRENSTAFPSLIKSLPEKIKEHGSDSDIFTE